MWHEVNEAYGLELLRCAIAQDDQNSRATLQHYLGETMLAWLHSHPNREMTCRWQSEEHYVALAFERFWQAALWGQVPFKTFAEALLYLRAGLHGAILDSLRDCSRPGAIPLPLLGGPGDPYVDDHSTSLEAWELLQIALPNRREQRLAYLLYHCGLSPKEVVRFCRQEFSDIQEIYRLRRNILERVLCNADQLRWQFNQGELL